MHDDRHADPERRTLSQIACSGRDCAGFSQEGISGDSLLAKLRNTNSGKIILPKINIY